MATLPPARMSIEEYLDQEERAELPSEYWNGEVFPMEGASANHGAIVINVGVALAPHVARSGCRAFAAPSLKIAATGLFTYPDLAVVCGELQYLDKRRYTILNPKLIVEVLSPSTEDHDLGVKLGHYRRIPSLVEYITIAQHTAAITQMTRLPDSTWLLKDIEGADQTLHLASLNADIPLAEIYFRVPFD